MAIHNTSLNAVSAKNFQIFAINKKQLESFLKPKNNKAII